MKLFANHLYPVKSVSPLRIRGILHVLKNAHTLRHADITIGPTHRSHKYPALITLHKAQLRAATKRYKTLRLGINSTLPHTTIISPAYYFTHCPCCLSLHTCCLLPHTPLEQCQCLVSAHINQPDMHIFWCLGMCCLHSVNDLCACCRFLVNL